MLALKVSSNVLFPNFHTIWRIILTFPITTCTWKRSTSVSNRVKSYNRTTQTDERLCGLCIIYAYMDTDMDWDEVVNIFAAISPRRMALINIMDYSKGTFGRQYYTFDKQVYNISIYLCFEFEVCRQCLYFFWKKCILLSFSHKSKLFGPIGLFFHRLKPMGI